MPGKIVHVRAADGREFDATPSEARRHGWEVIDAPQPEPQDPAGGEGPGEPAADNTATEGQGDSDESTGDPTETPADAADDPDANPADRKKKSNTNDQAAVIEPAPTSEGTDR